MALKSAFVVACVSLALVAGPRAVDGAITRAEKRHYRYERAFFHHYVSHLRCSYRVFPAGTK